MGDHYGLANTYLSSCPQFASCSYNDFSSLNHVLDQYKRVQPYFPLDIKPSTVEGAGLGIFTTARLEEKTLVGVYTGIVGTHHDSNASSDSLFELGWFMIRDKWTPLVTDGLRSNDGTRYANSNNGKAINLKAIIGVYREELTILYITCKVIEPNSELFVNYGKNYFERTPL